MWACMANEASNLDNTTAKIGFTLYFIPPYSSELNLIERLWLEVKYRWLDYPSYFASLNNLRTALDETLALIGTKYVVTFD